MPLSLVVTEKNLKVAPPELTSVLVRPAELALLDWKSIGTHETMGSNVFNQLLRLCYIPFADCLRLFSSHLCSPFFN